MRMRGLMVAGFVALGLVRPVVANAQTVEYVSPAGKEYRSNPDTGTVAKARAALATDPRNVDKIIAVAVAQSGLLQFREAIETLTKGLEMYPDNALLLRWRGHRYLSIREFAKAKADLTRGASLDSTIYGNWYHLGIVRFVEGNFNGAAEAFTHSLPKSPNPGEFKGSTDWLWMSLSRAGKTKEAKELLARHTDSAAAEPNYAYGKRLSLYRGEITPEQLIGPADTAAVQVATLNFGLGNWYLVQGDKAKAKAAFERSVASNGWAGFGFIMSEVELRGRK